MTYNVLPNQRVPFTVAPTRLDWLFVASAAEKLFAGDLAGGERLAQAISPGKVNGSPTTAYLLPTTAVATLDIGYNLVAFAGTQNVQQVYTEIYAAFPTLWFAGSGLVNAYFAAAATALYPRVIDGSNPALPYVLVGHSLGGALAQLVADILIDEGKTVAGVYAVGSPKVGNQTWAQNLRFPLYQLRATDDPVPSLPPDSVNPLPFTPGRWLKALKLVETAVGIGLYQQAGTMQGIDPSGTFTNLTEDMGLYAITMAFATGTWRSHFSRNYQERLRPALAASEWMFAFAGGYERPWLILDQIDFNLANPAQASSFVTVPAAWSNQFQTGIFTRQAGLMLNPPTPCPPPAAIVADPEPIPPPPVCAGVC